MPPDVWYLAFSVLGTACPGDDRYVDRAGSQPTCYLLGHWRRRSTDRGNRAGNLKGTTGSLQLWGADGFRPRTPMTSWRPPGRRERSAHRYLKLPAAQLISGASTFEALAPGPSRSRFRWCCLL